MTAATPERTPSQTLLGLRQLGGSVVTGIRALGVRMRPAFDAVARVVGPEFSAVGVLGWLVLAAAALCLAVGGVVGWVEFTYLGATLAAGFLVAICFAFGRATYRVTIELNPRRVVAGGRAMGRMLVVNAAEKSATPTRMELPVGVGVADFSVPRLAPGAEQEELFALPTHRRALIVAGPALSVRGDQLGLIRRTVRWSDAVELFVHPQTVRLHATARGLVRDLEGRVSAEITDSDLAFHALRPYEAGDDIRNVHWRTSARTGQLMVRQYNETRRSQLLLAHSAAGEDFASDDEFELAISVMASIGTQVIREKTNVDAVWDGGRMRTRSITALLDDSCRIGPVDDRPGDLRAFLRTATAGLPTPSLVILVVGSRVTAHQVRSATTLFGQETVIVTVRVEAGAAPSVAAIGGMRIATVGRLQDLPRLMERTGR